MNDLSAYKMSDQSRRIAEMKLNDEVLVSTNTHLVTDKRSLLTEVADVRGIMKNYERKCLDLMNKLTDTTNEHQELKRTMLNHTMKTNERIAKIEKLTKELKETKQQLRETQDKLILTESELEKYTELYNTGTSALEDTTDKLNKTHKHAHELEVALDEEMKKNANLREDLRIQGGALTRKTDDLEDFEKRYSH